jgi:hypothetical protein
VGDYNGDGIPDLAVASGYDGKVSIVLGNGDGTFQAGQGYILGYALAAGDFNGDGRADIVGIGTTASIMLGNGDGTFQAPQRYAAGNDPVSVAVADFNGDGHLDLAVANAAYPGTPSVSIFLGKGGGTFQAAPTYDAGGYSVAVGDFNGDGIPDLAAAGWRVSTLVGTGGGSFATGQSYAAGLFARAVVVGDYNGDGIPDLAVGSVEGIGYDGTVTVLLGNGDGTFQVLDSYTVGNRPFFLAVGDFNGDGILDIASANARAENIETPGTTVSVLLGRGDGTFQAPKNYNVGDGPMSVAVGDFNRDGVLDLVVANSDSGTISILLGKGDGTFQDAQSYAAGLAPSSVAVADFNGDGILDLAVANVYTVSIFLGNGDGTFQAGQSYDSVDAAATFLAIADFNRDGILDLAVAKSSGGTVSILLGKGDGTFQPAGDYVAGAYPA